MSYVAHLPFLAIAAVASATPQSLVFDTIGEPKPPARAYAVETLEPAAPATRDASTPRELANAANPLSVDHDRLYFDVDAAGTVWVRGRTYKAAFSAQSARYVPFLGSRAPRNFPLDLHVDSVTIAGEPLLFDTAAMAVRHGDTIEYARGPFVERYVLTPDSVEQSFEFADLPRRGEIVVTLRFETELAPATDVDGMRFANELGHVRYGRAFALHDELDATPIESRIQGDTLQLVAPAQIVEGAIGRFVIDPVISTYAVENSTVDEFAADTAYDQISGEWLTVCEETFSASDHDIHAQRHSHPGTPSASAYVDITTIDWRAPAVANNNAADQFLVVAERGTSPNRQIWGRTVEATVSLGLSAQFQISDLGVSGDRYAPDVGGDPSPNGTNFYAVVWEREFSAGSDYDIHARLVRSDTTLVGGGTLYVDNSPNSIHRNPAISNSNSIAPDELRDWNVVWEDEITSTNHNVLAARIHWDGTLSASTFPVASSSLDERNPSATCIVDDEGGTRPWLVAYQIDTGANSWDVRCKTLNGNSIISTFNLSDQFGTPQLAQITPSCDVNGNQFVVVYDERTSPFYSSTDIRISTLYSLGGALGINEGNVSASPGIFTDLRPRVVTASSSGSALDWALVVFDRDNGGPNDVYATYYHLPSGGPVTAYCFGDGSGTACPCGNSGAPGNGCASSVNAAGALLAHTGRADLSDDNLVLRASGLPSNAPVLFFQGTTQTSGGAGAVFGDGLRCASGTIVRLGTKTASAGLARYPDAGDPDVSVRGLVPVTGAVRYYQAWYRNAAAFCTASTFNLTNGLRVQWIL